MKKYQIEKFENYFVIKLEGTLSIREKKTFDEEMEMTVMLADQHVLVNCEKLVSLTKDWLRSLLKIQMTLKKTGKFLRLVNASEEVLVFMKDEGVSSAFVMTSTMREALLSLKLTTKKTLDSEFLNPFLNATVNVLQVQARVDPKMGKITVKKNENDFPREVSGILGIVCESFDGSVVISFPEKTFLKILSSMMGENILKIDDSALMAAGEITSLIFGEAKGVLNGKGYGLKIVKPSVVHTKVPVFDDKSKGPVVVVPFESSAGHFFVEICLAS
jgi:chemotaxis protein CheX